MRQWHCGRAEKAISAIIDILQDSKGNALVRVDAHDDAATRTAMLASGMADGMEVSYQRLEQAI